ncbi:MAG: FGGY-family carbohydrate kinase [Desulforegulaceae bacterium]|nr:FGGY-family carbohydrate kinase [Desulforegulaceae bacterium]
MESLVLSIDCGTQSLRVHIFDLKGNLLAGERTEYLPYFSKNPGWAEQNPDIFWGSTINGIKKLKQRNPELIDKIKGIGITAQRNTMICCDKNGNHLRDAITWLDQRKAAPVFKPNSFVKAGAKALGMLETIYKVQTEGKSNWIKQNEAQIWDKTFKYLQVSGFLNFKLTGEFKDSKASQIGHLPFNYKKMNWALNGEIQSLLFPIEKSKLPELVEPGDLIGKLSLKAAKETGLKKGIPIIACGSDKGCETIGMGVYSPEIASLSFGTTATVQTTSKKYFEPIKFMPAYPAPYPGHYNPEVEIFRGYWMITWYKNEFAHPEINESQKTGILPEVLLNKLLDKTPPGAMGLILQPFWSPGLNHLDAKGAIIGFGDVHTRAHVYRAVIEGLSFALYDGLLKIEKKSKIKVKKLAVSGGASQSDNICQISADIFNRPIIRGKTSETSGLGAAIITAAGLGFYKDIKEAGENMVEYGDKFYPDKSNALLYKKIYKNVYSKIYHALEPVYKEIRKITGYPEIYK